MVEIGAMSMPSSFEYKKVFLRGRPKHEKYDSFWCKHPPMDPGRWAKIFAPFDALEGFDEAVQAKEVLYSVKTELSEYEQEKLDRKIAALSRFTQNSRMARENNVIVSVVCFYPCIDPNHSAYGTPISLS